MTVLVLTSVYEGVRTIMLGEDAGTMQSSSQVNLTARWGSTRLPRRPVTTRVRC